LHIRLFHTEYLWLREGQWDTQDVRDAFWRFYVNDRDGASLAVPAGEFPLKAGQLYFVPEEVLFSCHNTQAIGHYFAHFDVIGLPLSMRRILFQSPIEIRDRPLQQESKRLAELVRQQPELTLALRCRVKALLLRALAVSLEQNESHWIPAAAYHQNIEPALQFIEEHLSEPIDNAQLARCCHWSTDHFSRRFHASVGKTPAQYVLERRIGVASQLLLFTDKTIEEIADETGFANRFHFSRAFARLMNCGPATYRRKPPV